MPNPAPPQTLRARSELLRSAYRGKRPGLLHDRGADAARRQVWAQVARSPRDEEMSVTRAAALQLTLGLIPGIVLAGTHLRGGSDARLLRHWQTTGRKPRGYGLYRLSGVVQLLGVLLTGVATLGIGLFAAYWLMGRGSERLVFQAPPRQARKGRRKRKRK